MASTASMMEVMPPLNLMLSDAEDAASELEDPETLDLSGHALMKLSRATPNYELTAMTLLLDGNNLQRLDNIHTYQCLEKVNKSLFTFYKPIAYRSLSI